MTDSVWMANFALTDTRSGEFHTAERLSRGHDRLAYARPEPLSIRVEDWHVEQTGPGSLRAIAATDDVAIDISLGGLDRIVLQGERGYDRKGPEPGNASYYYSAPRLTASGTVRDRNGTESTVSGAAWLDREWGTSALSTNVEGWDWFALQLSDGRDLMYYRLRQTDGGTSPFSGGSLLAADGSTVALEPDMVELAVIDYWRSRSSGVSYPVAWRLNIPEQNMELEVTPYLPDQEIDLSVRYWEGAVSVSGQANGASIAGNGYLELAGY